jgi:hypothetical protein
MDIYYVKGLLRISVHIIVFVVCIEMVAKLSGSNKYILNFMNDYRVYINKLADLLYKIIELTVNEIAQKLTMMIA